MQANLVADLLDETEEILCPCGYTVAIGGKCLRCGLKQCDADPDAHADVLDLQGEQQEFDENQDQYE